MAIPANGQVLYGTLTGNVNDSSGAVIPDATVKAVNEATGFTREAHTNAEGVYSMADLQPGIYDISISAPSFGGFEQKGTAVIVNSVQRLNATLQQGQVTQEVTITDAIPLLQTDKADSNYTLSTQQIENLPTTSSTGRNFQSLYKLVPGATSTASPTPPTPPASTEPSTPTPGCPISSPIFLPPTASRAST
jgi:hypothetical protein